MVSTVRGELRDSRAPGNLVRALFLYGSAAGAPKLRAVEFINELEKDHVESKGPRGVYCGGKRSFSPDGSTDFNVVIRTLMI
jgi:anthranilate/para-aminobenzoate synthase component I